MKDRILIETISNVFISAINLINEDDSSALFYDLDFLNHRVSHVKDIFPVTATHTIAVKANPLIKILEYFRDLGTGLEVASFPELYIAQKCGFANSNIVFDSPSKTVNEIEFALKNGVHLNADSFNELQRIDVLYQILNSSSNVGVRINPQIGSGTIETTSVADKISKFGIPISEHKEEIIAAYLKYDWLNGIHLHIGSQGISINQLIEGIDKVFTLAEEINQKLDKFRRIIYFDMGGGFPVSYKSAIDNPKIETYIELAKKRFPKLFSKKYKIITEFGRYINANSGWAISRVEYVKEEQEYKILSIHLGADFLLRKAYNPKDWHHEISVLDKYGKIKRGKDNKKYIVAGPLCFAGDIIAKDIELPFIEEGDFIVIHDVGAYTLSMWSRYNSRQIPKVIGYLLKDNKYELFKEREKVDDLYKFWH